MKKLKIGTKVTFELGYIFEFGYIIGYKYNQYLIEYSYTYQSVYLPENMFTVVKYDLNEYKKFKNKYVSVWAVLNEKWKNLAPKGSFELIIKEWKKLSMIPKNVIVFVTSTDANQLINPFDIFAKYPKVFNIEKCPFNNNTIISIRKTFNSTWKYFKNE